MSVNRVLGVIPAKGTSRRIPGKNMALVNNRPLVSYTIDHAKDAEADGIFDEWVVST